MSRVRAWAAGIGAFLAAFVASSHHTIHMALLSLGIGGSSLFFGPGVRRVMLLVSLAMTALMLWWLVRQQARAPAQTAALVASIAASLGLVAWSVWSHGW